jgi:predicted nucleic acid-binding protein
VRVVLDTNVLVAALITKNTPPDLLHRAWLRAEIEGVTAHFMQAAMTELKIAPADPENVDAL